MILPLFKNQKLFDNAFIHRSYVNEAKQKIDSNERLEFLGDSILSFVVSQELFKKYPEFNEGNLTNIRSLLVNTKILGETARDLGFGQFLRLSKGEEEANGRENQSLLADSFESYIGALFLDQGLEVVSKFIKEALFEKMDEVVKSRQFKDPKSLFQEYTQSVHHTSPVYKVLEETGPSHAKIFTVGVYIKDNLLGTGSGKSKQIAEEEAAKQALEKTSEK